MENIKFEEVQSLLDSGKQPEEIFDWIDFNYDWFSRVKLNNKFNYIDEINKLLSPDLWFDNIAGAFWDKLVIVTLNGKQNYMKPNGKLLSDTWFDWCEDFQDGFGMVGLNGEKNYIKSDGTFLSDIWFDECWGFKGGFAKVELNGEMCYINQNGELLHKK